jgi:hypothetical protein
LLATYAIVLGDGSLWRWPAYKIAGGSPAGEKLRSFAIIATRLNELYGELDDRMP